MSHIYLMWYHTYSGCDIIDSVGVMTQIQWTRCLTCWVWCPQNGGLRSKSEDVMSCIMQMMPHIWRVWWHKKSGCDVDYAVCVMTQIVAVMSHVKCVCCPHTGCGFIYGGCDVLNTVVWWHKDWVWCYIVHMKSHRRWVWCHTKLGELSVETVWWHR